MLYLYSNLPVCLRAVAFSITIMQLFPSILPACFLQTNDKKKKWEPPVPPPRVGKKQKKRGAAAGLGTKLPNITPNAKCKLRLLKLERVKDWLLMEEEFVANQERLKPQEERNEEDRSKVLLLLTV